MTIFERVVTRIQISSAAVTVLKDWLPTYIAEIERQNDLGVESLPVPRSYRTRTTTTKWAEDQTPAVVVVCPGLAGEPRMDGDGVYMAPWGLAVAVVAAGPDQESVIANASYYGAAVRACLLQRQPLPNVGGQLSWLDEDYVEVPENQSRSLAAARVEFECLIPDTVQTYAGPPAGASPPVDPYVVPPEYPTVNETSVDSAIADSLESDPESEVPDPGSGSGEEPEQGGP